MLLNRATGKDWGQDPAVPDPADPLHATVQPGGVRVALQDLYSAVFDVLRGVRTFKGLVIDAIGDASASPTPGTLKLTTNSAGVAVPYGTLYRDGLVIAKGVVRADATLAGTPYNLASVTRNGPTGSYRVITRTAPSEFAALADGTELDVCHSAEVGDGFSSPCTLSVQITKQTVAGFPVLRADVLILDVVQNPAVLVDKKFSLTLG